MFGTCVAVIDGYARSASECIKLVRDQRNSNKIYYDILIWVLVIGSLGIIIIFGDKKVTDYMSASSYVKVGLMQN